MRTVAPALTDLAALLGWNVGTAAHEAADDRQAVCDAANRCQVLVGRSQLYRKDVLSDLASLIETFPVMRSPHSRSLLQTIWLRTLRGILVAISDQSTAISPSVLEMVARCIRACERYHPEPRTRAVPPWPPAVIEIILCIGRRLDDPTISLKCVAADVGMSPWYLDRQLRRHVGTSFVPLVRALRVLQAMNLMRSTSTLSVKEVAAAVGYNYVTSFDRDFKKVQGMTPTEWRRQRCHERMRGIA